jgi:hypothetical protein
LGRRGRPLLLFDLPTQHAELVKIAGNHRSWEDRLGLLEDIGLAVPSGDVSEHQLVYTRVSGQLSRSHRR